MHANKYLLAVGSTLLLLGSAVFAAPLVEARSLTSLLQRRQGTPGQ